MGSLFVSFWIWEVSVGLGQSFSESSGQSSSGFEGFQVVFLDFLQVEVIYDKSGWDDVVLVDWLDEGLDSSSLDEFFFIDASFDSSWVSSDTEDSQMGESVFLKIRGEIL